MSDRPGRDEDRVRHEGPYEGTQVEEATEVSEDEGPQIEASPEMTEALREATEAVEARESSRRGARPRPTS